MKKVLIGVGIGCGTLVLLAMVAVMAGGFWLKGKAETFVADVAQSEKRVEALNKKHAFAAPPKGQPVRLGEARLRDYLQVRAALTPVFERYQQQAKKFDDKKQPASMGEAMEAISLVKNLVGDLNTAWLEQLDNKRMSPQEFHAITAAVYGSTLAGGLQQMREGQRVALEQMRAELDRQANDPSLDAEGRRQVQEQAEQMQKQLAQLPKALAQPPEAEKIHAENARVLEAMGEGVTKDANPGLDLLLWGFASGNDSLSDVFGGMNFDQE